MLHIMSTKRNPTHAQEAVRLRTGKEPADLLRELYVEERLSQGEIADRIGISRATVAMWLREYGLLGRGAVA